MLNVLHELNHMGKIFQILWDTAELQRYQRQLYENVGKLALELAKDGKIEHVELQKALAKIDQSERIIQRQEKILQGYQQKINIEEILQQDIKDNEDHLAPV